MKIQWRKISRILGVLAVAAVMAGAVAAQDDKPVVSPESGKEYQAGLDLFKQGKYADSIARFRKAYELDERNVAAVFAEGLALNKSGKYKDAAAVYRKVIELDPRHEKARRMYPAALSASGDDEAAIAAYDAGIEAMPDVPGLYLGKALVLRKLKRYEDMVAPLKKGIEKAPKDTDLHETLGFAYYQMKDFKQAFAQYDKAVTLKPADTQLRYLRAQVLMELGRTDEACREAKDILAKNANHARARLIVADCLRGREQWDEAKKEYEAAAKNIETRAYAQHYIEVIDQKLEELEIEKEWQARQQKKGNK